MRRLFWPFNRCEHQWVYRAVHGDERLALGRVEEWYCIKCRKITGKRPNVYGTRP